MNPEPEKNIKELDLTRPGFFMILSYFVMLLLIKDVDFSYPTYTINLKKILNVIGALEAAKSMRVEVIIISLLPAIGLLVFFVYLSAGSLRIFGEQIDGSILRRNYSYMLGNSFLLLGISYYGNETIMRPLGDIPFVLKSGLGLLLSLPAIGMATSIISLVPLYTLDPSYYDMKKSRYFARVISIVLPLLLLALLMYFYELHI